MGVEERDLSPLSTVSTLVVVVALSDAARDDRALNGSAVAAAELSPAS